VCVGEKTNKHGGRIDGETRSFSAAVGMRGEFSFKLCACSARCYAAVRDRSAFLAASISSLECLLCRSLISRYAGTAVICKIEVVCALLLRSSTRVFIPFAHQTAAIIRAGWADLATVEGGCKSRPLWRFSTLIGSNVVFLELRVGLPANGIVVRPWVTFVGPSAIRIVLYVYFPKKVNLIQVARFKTV